MQESGMLALQQRDDMNYASQWRLALARWVAAAYAANPSVAAVIVGGSTARGHADRYSDIEVGVFWHQPPTDEDRTSAGLVVTQAAGWDAPHLYPYDPAEEMWEDDLFLGHITPGQPATGVLVEVPHYTAEFVERVLIDVLEHHDPSDLKQSLLAAITTAIPVHGESLIEAWRARAAAYPRELAVAVVQRHAQIDHFWRTDMFLERGNNLMLLYDTLVQVSKKLLYVLLALNRAFYSGFLWAHLQMSGLDIAPADFYGRLRRVFQSEPATAARELQALVEEVYNLVEQEMPEVDVDWLRRVFRWRRQPWDAPPEHVL